MLFSTCASLPSLSSEAQSIVLNHPNRNMATQIRLSLSYLKSNFKTCNWNCKRIYFNLFYWDCLEKYCCSASGGLKKIVYVGSMGHSLTTFQLQLLAKLELGTAQPQLVNHTSFFASLRSAQKLLMWNPVNMRHYFLP